MSIHIGCFCQVTAIYHIARIKLAIAFENIPALILAFSYMHILDYMIRNWIYNHVTSWPIPRNLTTSECVHYCLSIMCPSFADSCCPKHSSNISTDSN